jgi:hypothetical protein
LTFDEKWFIVTNNNVTLNEEQLNTVIDEVVNTLNVDIEVYGLLEHTNNSTGKLNAITKGNLTLDTNVTY